tara:strand:- start:2007 stop:2201 length:195 start_codon:yes stop_codon:yes gene_type:complete
MNISKWQPETNYTYESYTEIGFIDNNKENFLKIATDCVTGELIYYDNKNSKWKPIPSFIVEASK